MHNIYLSLLIMCGTVYLSRILPLIFLRKEIKNRFIRSFLYYVPYVTLAVMTFPAILAVTQDYRCGLIALIAGTFLGLVIHDKISQDIFGKVIYAFVGVSGVWIIVSHLI